MSKNKKKSGCSGTILLLLLVGFVSLFFVDLDAGDLDKRNLSTTNRNLSYSSVTMPSNYTTTQGSTNSTTTTQSTTVSTTQHNNNSNNYNGIESTDLLYKQLDAEQQEVYNTLLEGVPDGETEFEFGEMDYDTFRHAYNAYLYEHPEVFWLDLNVTYYYGLDGNFNVTLQTYDYWTYSNDRQKYIDELDAKIEEIIRGGSHCVTDYDKVKYVHDYLCNNIAYDYDTAENMNNTIRDVSTEQALSVYGALINGKCVCGGYSESLYLLLNAMGVDCYYVQGYGNDGYHAWNYLEIDGEYYLMDVTWDDPDVTDYTKGIYYKYFCLTDDEMATDHKPDVDFPLPDCNGTEYNFFRYNDSYFSTYDIRAIRKAFETQKNSQFVNIKFSNKNAFDKAVTELFDNNTWQDIPELEARGLDWKYITDDKWYIIVFYL